MAAHPFDDPTYTGTTWPWADVRVLVPILPLKVVGIGKNAVAGFDSGRLRGRARRGGPCRDVSAAQASSVLLGYTIANDVTARDQQKADGQWTRGKGHDTFCPLGPWIETAADPADLVITTTVDGEKKQDSRTSLLLHDMGALVEWVSKVMTLLTGTSASSPRARPSAE